MMMLVFVLVNNRGRTVSEGLGKSTNLDQSRCLFDTNISSLVIHIVITATIQSLVKAIQHLAMQKHIVFFFFDIFPNGIVYEVHEVSAGNKFQTTDWHFQEVL